MGRAQGGGAPAGAAGGARAVRKIYITPEEKARFAQEALNAGIDYVEYVRTMKGV